MSGCGIGEDGATKSSSAVACLPHSNPVAGRGECETVVQPLLVVLTRTQEEERTGSKNRFVRSKDLGLLTVFHGLSRANGAM